LASSVDPGWCGDACESFRQAQMKGDAASVKLLSKKVWRRELLPQERCQVFPSIVTVSQKKGGYFQSVDYDATECKVELDLSMGVGSISVK
jgi:hypothetical protein